MVSLINATKQLSCTYIDHSRDFILQVKNIFNYNCFHKPNIMQTSFKIHKCIYI